MLRIYDDVQQLIRELAPRVAKLRARSANLADQVERALSAVPLRIAEGSYSRGKNRAAHYHGGAGSMQEAIGVFDTGASWGWIQPLPPELRDRMEHARNVLFKNAR
jgi:hypothetical protein